MSTTTDITKTQQSPTSAFAVANWFLDKAESESKPLTLTKLQMLVYLAYGWYYAYCDEPLFEDVILMAPHGLEIAAFASMFAKSNKPIDHRAKIFQDEKIEILEPSIHLSNEEMAMLDKDEREMRITLENYIEDTLAVVWEGYSGLPHEELLKVIYRPTSPLDAYYNFSENVFAIQISPRKIHNYFKALLNDYNK